MRARADLPIPDSSRPQMIKHSLLALALASLTVGAAAQPAVDAFSKCLADHTTGKDRKDLARWIFVAMGAHPEMRAIAELAPTAPQESSKTAGELFTRLMVESCPDQARAAVQARGGAAIQAGFNVLGQLAMQELMSDREVAARMGLLEQYVDTAKLQSVLGAR